MSSKVEIIINAKNNASAVFDTVSKNMKTMGDNYQKASGAVSMGTDAVSKAMRGDLVGAAQSAIGAFKALGTAMMSNPWMAVAVAIGAAVTALIAFNNKQKEIAKELEALKQRNANAAKSVKEILEGTNLDKAQAKAEELKATGPTEEMEAEVARLKKEAEEAVQAAAKQVEDWSKRAERDVKSGNKKDQEKSEQQRDLWLAELRERKAILDEYAGLEAWAADEKIRREEKAAKEAEEIAKQEAKDKEAAAKAEAKAREEAEKEKLRIEKEYADKRAAIERDLAKEKARLQDLEFDATISFLEKQAEAEKKLMDEANQKMADSESDFAKSGLGGLKERRENARKEREAARAEREIQRQIERWNEGRRDSRAQAAHEIDEARKNAAAQKENFDRVDRELAAAREAKERDKLNAIKDCADKVKKLSDALIGGTGEGS